MYNVVQQVQRAAPTTSAANPRHSNRPRPHRLPQDCPFELDMLHERRFTGGVVHLHYRTMAG